MKPAYRKYSLTLASFLLCFTLLLSCKKEYSAEDVPIPPVVKDHNLLIKFLPVVDTIPLEFGKVAYKNHFKENYSVTAFKFYLHDIQLINTDSNYVFKTSAEKYWLVDFSDSTTTAIKLNVLPYKYNRISFLIGVDSARNTSGAQTGALDPTKGMFWTWNSGYIMAKLEGTSSASPTGKFEFHIGGFSGPDNALRNPELLFPYAQNIDLKPEKSSEMLINANANAWFFNPHDIKLSVNPVCTTPGPLARQISENYSKMFTVDSVYNQ